MRTKRQATVCGLLFIAALAGCMGAVRAGRLQKESRYTTSWAVQVEGGKEQADEVASRCGFVNLGKVPRFFSEKLLARGTYTYIVHGDCTI